MARSRRKFSWKSLLCVALGVLILAGAFSAFSALRQGTVAISPTAFSVGGLDPETGKFVDRKDAIYTAEAFSAQGLRVKPGFEVENLKYQIFFYDENDRFLEATDELTEAYTEQTLRPTYARIVIYPSQLDDDGNLIDDFKVHFYEVLGIAKSLSIKVDADQSKVFSPNLFVAGADGVSAKMEIRDYKSLLLHLPNATVTDTRYTLTFYAEKTDAEGTITYKELDDTTVSLQNYGENEWLWHTVSRIPSGATHVTVTYYDSNVNLGVYGVER